MWITQRGRKKEETLLSVTSSICSLEDGTFLALMHNKYLFKFLEYREGSKDIDPI
jgi:hypothetical protein